MVSAILSELLAAGYQVQVCQEMGEALGEALAARAPEILLVEAPCYVETVKELRHLPPTPSPGVLVLVQYGKLEGIELAPPPDDILIVPARPGELVARLALLRWRLEKVDASETIIAYGLTIDLANYCARVDDRPVDLTYKEFELLRFLTTHRGRVYTREALLNQVWGYEYFGGARTVDVHVRRVRAKLGEPYDSLIETVRNVGYRFAAGES